VKRGRRGDRPAVKAAKAGQFRQADRRKRSKAPVMSADERAAMLAGLGDGDVPAFLLDEKVDFRMELDVWKDQAPHLKRMNALQKPDRYTFAIYCVHMADWIRATLDIRKNGATYKARSTITKDVLHKLNPMVRVRNDAERAILDLATRFGLDPLSRFKLVGIQAGLVGQGMLPGLLEGDGAQKRVDEPQQEDGERPTGMLTRSAAPPPRAN
jgi:P27 family predicted phage terminase small subunit